MLRGSFPLAPGGFHKLGDSLSPPYFIRSAMHYKSRIVNLPPYKSSALTHLSLLYLGPLCPENMTMKSLPLQEEDSPALQHPIISLRVPAVSPASRFTRPCGAKTPRLASRCGVLLPERSCDPLLGMETWEAEHSRERAGPPQVVGRWV